MSEVWEKQSRVCGTKFKSKQGLEAEFLTSGINQPA